MKLKLFPKTEVSWTETSIRGVSFHQKPTSWTNKAFSVRGVWVQVWHWSLQRLHGLLRQFAFGSHHQREVLVRPRWSLTGFGQCKGDHKDQPFYGAAQGRLAMWPAVVTWRCFFCWVSLLGSPFAKYKTYTSAVLLVVDNMSHKKAEHVGLVAFDLCCFGNFRGPIPWSPRKENNDPRPRRVDLPSFRMRWGKHLDEGVQFRFLLRCLICWQQTDMKSIQSKR